MYLQQFPDSAIAINLKACNHFRLYNGKAAEAELKALQDMASPSFQFAQDLIKHNLVRRLHKQTHVHCCSFGRGEFSTVPLNVCVLFRFSWCVCVISFIRVHVHAALIVMVHYVPRLFKIRVFLYTECFVYRVYMYGYYLAHNIDMFIIKPCLSFVVRLYFEEAKDHCNVCPSSLTSYRKPG